jgi:signal transduction histidine kinase
VNVIARETDVWFSYLGTTGGSGGVSRLRDGTWSHFSGAARDLTSGYEDGAFFFTHPRGVYIVARDPAQAARLVALPEPTRVVSLVAGPQGDLWAGSATRIFHHEPDGIPPDTVIVDGETDVPHGRDLTLQVRGVERFKSRSVPRNFNVAVQVDDRPWGEFEPLLDGTVTLGDLTTGDHVVRVRVQDEGLDIDPTPATWPFRLKAVPLQDRSWFRPLAAGVLLTVLLLAALSIFTRQREIAQRRKKHQLEHEILQISEREQRRIGRDLHDGLGQRLTSISFQCKALHGMLERGDTPSPQRAREIGAAVRTAIAETRGLAHALYPAEIDSGSLEIALGNLVTSVDRTFDGKCDYHHQWSPAGLRRDDSLNVYRLVQEALVNAIRHAGAETLRVESRRDSGQWVVEVRDDGRGFDTADTSGTGLGLQIMRYRANLIGGTLEVTSKPGAGTTIRCALRI